MPHQPPTFCKTLEAMMSSGRVTGASGKTFDDLGALSTVNNLRTLRWLLGEHKPQRTLEAGMAFGGSALVFAAVHRELGRPPCGQHIAVDPNQSTVWDNTGRKHLQQEGLEGYVRVMEQPTYLALPALLAAGGAVDFAYIDGSHIFEDVFLDAFFVTHLLAPGGLMAFDDSQDRHVAKVLRFIDANLRHLLQRVDAGGARADDPFWARCRFRLAAALGKQQMTVYRKTAATSGELRPWNAPFHNF